MSFAIRGLSRLLLAVITNIPARNHAYVMSVTASARHETALLTTGESTSISFNYSRVSATESGYYASVLLRLMKEVYLPNVVPSIAWLVLNKTQQMPV